MKTLLFLRQRWVRVGKVLAVIACTSLGGGSRAAAEQGAANTVRPTNLSLRQEVRHALDQGVAWLEKNQDAQGYWSTPDQPAVTALALLALRAAGVPADRPTLRRGFEYIASSAQPEGGIYRKPELVTYNTALSMIALMAAQRAEYRPLILKARQFLVGLQSDFGGPGQVDDVFDGGVGYGSRYKHSDMSNTMQALEALYYSKQLTNDQNVVGSKDLNWAAAIHFLQNCQNLPEYNQQPWVASDRANRGGFVYYPGHSMAGETNVAPGRVALRSYGSISYAGLLSYIYADLKPDDPRVKAVLTWLEENYTLEENPGMGPQGLFYYFHTMAKGLSLAGVDTLQTRDGSRVDWREALAIRLVGLQQKDGSWVNAHNRWWENNPSLVTAYAVISLARIYDRL